MKKTLYILMVTTALAGCTMTPDYQRPTVDTPDQWQKDFNATAAKAPSVVSADWWKTFGSDELNSVMDTALAQNNDLLAALHRVEQARASSRIAGAPLLPSVGASGSAGWDKTRDADGESDTGNSGKAGVNVGYELDLFGARRAELQAAQAAETATVYDRDALSLVVMADTANAYFSVLDLRERIRISRENLENAKDVLKIVQSRFDAGAVSALDLSRQKTDLAANQAALASLQQQQAESENALSVLLGQAPGKLEVKNKNLNKLKIPEVTPDLPSTLLERRPDLRSAEAGLMAADANIGAARAAFFPTINLTASAAALFNPLSAAASEAYGLGSALTAPIFEGGRLTGNLEKTKARQQELVENYRKAALTSFQEVSDALNAVKTARVREKYFETALTESRKTYKLARELYDSGAEDFQTLLDSQRSLYASEESHAISRRERLSATVDLYKALGGGWVQ